MKKIVGTIALLFTLITAYGQSNQAVPFTLQDRDRIMHTEQKVESLRNEMNEKPEELTLYVIEQQKEIEELKAKVGKE